MFVKGKCPLSNTIPRVLAAGLIYVDRDPRLFNREDVNIGGPNSV